MQVRLVWEFGKCDNGKLVDFLEKELFPLAFDGGVGDFGAAAGLDNLGAIEATNLDFNFKEEAEKFMQKAKELIYQKGWDRFVFVGDDCNYTNHNINAHIEIHKKNVAKMMCELRGIGLTTGPSLERFGKDVLQTGKQLGPEHPETFPNDLQCLEWELSRIVQEAGQLIQHAGRAQEYVHGLRGGNETTLRIMAEKKRREVLKELDGVKHRLKDSIVPSESKEK